MSNFITPKELLACLDEVIILDARGYQDYQKGHIKGSYAVDLNKDLTGPLGEHGGRHPLPDMEQLAHTFESYGITRDSKVVVYDSWLFLAGRLWWTLRYMGLSDVRVLSGGIERWVKEGHVLTKDPTPLPTEPTVFNYELQTHMVMSRDEVLKASESGDHVIIDARAPFRYDGSQVDTMDGMTGHIPGANHFYESGYTVDGPKSVKDLEAEYYNEIYQNRPVVTYCGSGVTACNALLTMSEVGLESALYVGSSSDWVTYDGFPLKTGVEMKILKHLLTLVAFGYLCYHIYTFGPGMFNVTVLVILVLSSIANYFREKRESDLKANENARKARAEARHAKKHKQ